MRLAIAWHALRRGHALTFKKVTVGFFDPSAEGYLVDCSCGEGWGL